jgi:hypothetical protein
MKEYILNKNELDLHWTNYLNEKYNFTDTFNLFDYFDMSNENVVYSIIMMLPYSKLNVELFDYYFLLNPKNKEKMRQIYYRLKNITNNKISISYMEQYIKDITCDSIFDLLDLILHINVFKTIEKNTKKAAK